LKAKEIRHLKEVCIDILVAATNRSREEITRDIDRDYYMGSEQAKEYGLIDEVFVRKRQDAKQKG
jgi:ATP-dependent Clp protease, protease subunit